MNLGTATVIRADARRLPLPDNSVDLVVTSPPYFALRSYQDDGEHYVGQLGSEATPAEFVDALLEVTRECMRVLKPTGSLWVNLGDKYSGGSSGNRNNGFNERWGNAPGKRAQEQSQTDSTSAIAGFQPKTLLGIPWRYAIACIDQLGLILRAEVIWSKPNGLPESVTDRVRRSHEVWFHFTLQPRYYSAIDEIREASITFEHKSRYAGRYRYEDRDGQTLGLAACNPLGKLPGSVWTIPTEPLTVPPELGVDHFAAFPTEWPRRIIQGWSPAGICVECGEGRRPNADRVLTTDRGGTQSQRLMGTPITGGEGRQTLGWERVVTITGYACACRTPNAPTRPAVTLDPFGGTGTVALVAKALGRHGISIDLSHDYSRLAQWRTSDPGQLAKAARVDKPPAQTIDQLDLFAGGAA